MALIEPKNTESDEYHIRALERVKRHHLSICVVGRCKYYKDSNFCRLGGIKSVMTAKTKDKGIYFRDCPDYISEV